MELKRAMMVLWKWWRLFSVAFLIVFISTIVFTFTQTPIYETNVRLIVSPSSVLMSDLNDLRSAVTALSAPVVTNTYAEISQSPSTVEKAWKQLDIRPQKTYHVISTVLQETTIVSITVSGPDPKLTRDLANAITDQTMTYVEGLTTVYNLTLLDPAVTPELPSKPTYLLNLVLGIIIGLMTGVMLAFMAEYLTASAGNKANE
jgi:capsular polysaccharide biosynthesis protein